MREKIHTEFTVESHGSLIDWPAWHARNVENLATIRKIATRLRADAEQQQDAHALEFYETILRFCDKEDEREEEWQKQRAQTPAACAPLATDEAAQPAQAVRGAAHTER